MNQQKLEQIIGYSFKDITILNKALTHASKAPEHLERQEFLGDAVLDLIISDKLIRQYPEKSEGDLSKLRSALVNENSLSFMSSHL